MRRATWTALTATAIATHLAGPAAASFHEMQIEQVIAGVNTRTNFQAVQMRMRASFQNLVSNASLYVRDASGANPVLLIAFPTNVANSAAGSRVLVATSSFAAATTPSVTPDFILTQPIPDSYLAAGTLTWEDNFGDVYWRLSWGGANYTGSGAGSIVNDADGDFNPPYPFPLPTSSTQALRFLSSASALSTNNANDYALTPGAATFTNNAGQSGTIDALAGVAPGSLATSLALSAVNPNPVGSAMSYSITLARQSRVQVRILDVSGRVVRSLLDETLSGGSHDFAWNASSAEDPALHNGVYFLDLDSEGTHRLQRFVLLR
jgi:hypothetical protein